MPIVMMSELSMEAKTRASKFIHRLMKSIFQMPIVMMSELSMEAKTRA